MLANELLALLMPILDDFHHHPFSVLSSVDWSFPQKLLRRVFFFLTDTAGPFRAHAGDSVPAQT